MAFGHRAPDQVISGINRGYNAGMVTYISGMVGGAREATLQGIPAIASALDTAGYPNYAAAAEFTVCVAQMVKARGLDRRYFWNVFLDLRDTVEGTDVWAAAHGYVAVTPLRIGEFDRSNFPIVRSLTSAINRSICNPANYNATGGSFCHQSVSR